MNKSNLHLLYKREIGKYPESISDLKEECDKEIDMADDSTIRLTTSTSSKFTNLENYIQWLEEKLINLYNT